MSQREYFKGDYLLKLYTVPVPITYDETAWFLDDLHKFIGWGHSEGGAQTNHEVGLLGMLKGPIQNLLLQVIPKINDSVLKKAFTVLHEVI